MQRKLVQVGLKRRTNDAKCILTVRTPPEGKAPYLGTLFWLREAFAGEYWKVRIKGPNAIAREERVSANRVLRGEPMCSRVVLTEKDDSRGDPI